MFRKWIQPATAFCILTTRDQVNWRWISYTWPQNKNWWKQSEDFRNTWRKVCKQVGVTILFIHTGAKWRLDKLITITDCKQSPFILENLCAVVFWAARLKVERPLWVNLSLSLFFWNLPPPCSQKYIQCTTLCPLNATHVIVWCGATSTLISALVLNVNGGILHCHPAWPVLCQQRFVKLNSGSITQCYVGGTASSHCRLGWRKPSSSCWRSLYSRHRGVKLMNSNRYYLATIIQRRVFVNLERLPECFRVRIKPLRRFLECSVFPQALTWHPGCHRGIAQKRMKIKDRCVNF